MAEQFYIHLIRVPGHRNIPGNFSIDEIASLGTTLQIRGSLEAVDIANFYCDTGT